MLDKRLSCFRFQSTLPYGSDYVDTLMPYISDSISIHAPLRERITKLQPPLQLSWSFNPHSLARATSAKA